MRRRLTLAIEAGRLLDLLLERNTNLLPEGGRFCGVHHDWQSDTFHFVFDYPADSSVPEAPEGAHYPRVWAAADGKTPAEMDLERQLDWLLERYGTAALERRRLIDENERLTAQAEGDRRALEEGDALLGTLNKRIEDLEARIGTQKQALSTSTVELMHAGAREADAGRTIEVLQEALTEARNTIAHQAALLKGSLGEPISKTIDPATLQEGKRYFVEGPERLAQIATTLGLDGVQAASDYLDQHGIPTIAQLVATGYLSPEEAKRRQDDRILQARGADTAKLVVQTFHEGVRAARDGALPDATGVRVETSQNAQRIITAFDKED